MFPDQPGQQPRTREIKKREGTSLIQDIIEMEKIEVELIQKLQEIQVNQKKAYNELESALILKPQEFEKNFLSEINSQPERDISENKTQLKFKKINVENE